MNLVEQYLKIASEVVGFSEYDNKKAVDNYNRKIDEMRQIALRIESEQPDLKNKFCELLCDDSQKIRLWAAHHVLEVMSCDKQYRKSALKEIRNNAEKDKSASGYAEKMWLKEWYKAHPKDRWI